MANTMMQKFWDSALALEPPDDTDTQRYASFQIYKKKKKIYADAGLLLIDSIWDRCFGKKKPFLQMQLHKYNLEIMFAVKCRQ